MKFSFKVLLVAVVSVAVVGGDGDGNHVRRKRNPLPLLSLMQGGCGVGGQPPLLNLLLYNYLLQNLGSTGIGSSLPLSPSPVPLARNAPQPAPVVTQTVRTKVFTTVITDTTTTALPIIFRGAPLLTTLTESFVKTITATSYDTVPVTIYPTATSQFPAVTQASIGVDSPAAANVVADALKLIQDKMASSSSDQPETLVQSESRFSPTTFIDREDDRLSLESSKDPDFLGADSAEILNVVEKVDTEQGEPIGNFVIEEKPRPVVMTKLPAQTTSASTLQSSTRSPTFTAPLFKKYDPNHRRLLLNRRFGSSASSSTRDTPLATSKLATQASSLISPTKTANVPVHIVSSTVSTPTPVFKSEPKSEEKKKEEPKPSTEAPVEKSPEVKEDTAEEEPIDLKKPSPAEKEPVDLKEALKVISVSVSSSSSSSSSTGKSRKKRETSEVEPAAVEIVSSLIDRYGWDTVQEAVMHELESDIAGSLCAAPVTVTRTVVATTTETTTVTSTRTVLAVENEAS